MSSSICSFTYNTLYGLKKNKMSTNAYSIFFFLFDLKQTLQKSDAIDTKCTLSKCTHLTKNKTDLVLVQYFFLTF